MKVNNIVAEYSEDMFVKKDFFQLEMEGTLLKMRMGCQRNLPNPGGESVVVYERRRERLPERWEERVVYM